MAQTFITRFSNRGNRYSTRRFQGGPNRICSSYPDYILATLRYFGSNELTFFSLFSDTWMYGMNRILHRWQVEAICTARSTVLARHVEIEDQPTARWYGVDFQVVSQRFIVNAPQCPCLGVSLQTSQDVEDFLSEQGYPFVRCSEQDAHTYAHFLDRPEGLGATRKEQMQRKSDLLKELEERETPLIYYGCWPNGYRAALSITGDIDSITIQDFFRRVIEV